MFWNYDITFCCDKSCPRESCMRHRTRIPVGVPVSISDLSCYRNENGDCEYYYQVEEDKSRGKRKQKP